jgi:hypothetical protein
MAIAAFLLAWIWPSPAVSAGALAIGEPAHIEKRGLAIGTAYNAGSREAAEAGALKRCLNFMDAPPDTRALCKVVKTFENQCSSTALDPKAGTPGFGWAVMDKRADAEAAAVDNCRRTAGKSRVEFCKVATSECDEPRPPPAK